jgi:hypothetical protein
MFLRYRKRGGRLHVSLVRAKRVDGKVQSEHVVSLGSVNVESGPDRLAFWLGANPRLKRFRVGSKIYAALNARVPYTLNEEENEAANAESFAETRYMWTALSDLTAPRLLAKCPRCSRRVSRSVEELIGECGDAPLIGYLAILMGSCPNEGDERCGVYIVRPRGTPRARFEAALVARAWVIASRSK